MPDASEIYSLNEAAATAAAAGDYPAAIALLRRVLDRQGAVLGPDHPDLATTLNNLALMLERGGHVDEAGQAYRRAHEIAVAALPPGDPLIQVSDENLTAFHRAHGWPGPAADTSPSPLAPSGSLPDLPLSPPPSAPPPSPAPSPGAPAERSASPVAATPPESVPARPDAASRPLQQPAPRPQPVAAPVPAARDARRRWSHPAVLALGAVLGLAGAAWLWQPAAPVPALPADARPPAPAAAGAASEEASAGRPVTSPASGEIPARAAEARLAAEAPPAAEVPVPDADSPVAAASGPTTEAPPAVEPSTPPALPPAETPVERSSPPSASPAETPAGSALPGVKEAQLCRELSPTGAVWRCEPVRGPVRGGTVSYYTRVASPRDIVIAHRWSRDGRVVRETSLRIGANPAAGYRTFSRQTVSNLDPGEWRVALVGPGGRVLDEQRFVVE